MGKFFKEASTKKLMRERAKGTDVYKVFKKEVQANEDFALYDNASWLGKKIMNRSAPPKYIRQVSQISKIRESAVRPYVYNIRPQRFGVSPKTFAADLVPLYKIKAEKYNPLNAGLRKTVQGSKAETIYLKKHKKALDKHLYAWMKGHQILRKKYIQGKKSNG